MPLEGDGSVAALQVNVGLVLFVADPLSGLVRVGEPGLTVSITIFQYPE
jgi:hypothetical protein